MLLVCTATSAHVIAAWHMYMTHDCRLHVVVEFSSKEYYYYMDRRHSNYTSLKNEMQRNK